MPEYSRRSWISKGIVRTSTLTSPMDGPLEQCEGIFCKIVKEPARISPKVSFKELSYSGVNVTAITMLTYSELTGRWWLSMQCTIEVMQVLNHYFFWGCKKRERKDSNESEITLLFNYRLITNSIFEKNVLMYKKLSLLNKMNQTLHCRSIGINRQHEICPGCCCDMTPARECTSIFSYQDSRFLMYRL